MNSGQVTQMIFDYFTRQNNMHNNKNEKNPVNFIVTQVKKKILFTSILAEHFLTYWRFLILISLVQRK